MYILSFKFLAEGRHGDLVPWTFACMQRNQHEYTQLIDLGNDLHSTSSNCVQQFCDGMSSFAQHVNKLIVVVDSTGRDGVWMIMETPEQARNS